MNAPGLSGKPQGVVTMQQSTLYGTTLRVCCDLIGSRAGSVRGPSHDDAIGLESDSRWPGPNRYLFVLLKLVAACSVAGRADDSSGTSAESTFRVRVHWLSRTISAVWLTLYTRIFIACRSTSPTPTPGWRVRWPGLLPGDASRASIVRLRLLPRLLDCGPPPFLLEPLPLLPSRRLRRDPWLFLPGGFLERGPQSDERDPPIPVLATRIARGNGNPRRQVRQADARLGLVLMLAARSARAERLDTALGEEHDVVFRNLVVRRQLGVGSHIEG